MLSFIETITHFFLIGVAMYAYLQYTFDKKVAAIQKEANWEKFEHIQERALMKKMFAKQKADAQHSYNSEIKKIKQESLDGILHISNDFKRKMELLYFNEENKLPSFFTAIDINIPLLEVNLTQPRRTFPGEISDLRFFESPHTFEPRRGFLKDDCVMKYFDKFTPELLQFSEMYDITNPTLSMKIIQKQLAQSIADFMIYNNFIFNAGIVAKTEDFSGHKVHLGFKYYKHR